MSPGDGGRKAGDPTKPRRFMLASLSTSEAVMPKLFAIVVAISLAFGFSPAFANCGPAHPYRDRSASNRPKAAPAPISSRCGLERSHEG